MIRSVIRVICSNDQEVYEVVKYFKKKHGDDTGVNTLILGHGMKVSICLINGMIKADFNIANSIPFHKFMNWTFSKNDIKDGMMVEFSNMMCNIVKHKRDRLIQIPLKDGKYMTLSLVKDFNKFLICIKRGQFEDQEIKKVICDSGILWERSKDYEPLILSKDYAELCLFEKFGKRVEIK